MRHANRFCLRAGRGQGRDEPTDLRVFVIEDAGRDEVAFVRSGRHGYLSTSPTTKKIDPRIAIRSGISVPGSIAGSTEMFEKLAVRIFSR